MRWEDEPIILSPLDFERALAWMEMSQRIDYNGEGGGFSIRYTFRDHLVQVAQ